MASNGSDSGRYLQVNVGGKGGTNAGGWNGGAAGRYPNAGATSGGGGGASDVRVTENGSAPQHRLITAGGGGGGGNAWHNGLDGGRTDGAQTTTPDGGAGDNSPSEDGYAGGGGGGYLGGRGGLAGYGGDGGTSQAGTPEAPGGIALSGSATNTSGLNSGDGKVEIRYTIPHITSFTWANSKRLNNGDTYTIKDGGGNDTYHLAMQGDGNLVTYNSAWQPVWASGTNTARAYAEFTADGVLEVHKPNGDLIWKSANPGGTSSTLTLATDGNLNINNASGNRWKTLIGERLYKGIALEPNQAVSINGGYHLVMQYDGNLVDYQVNTTNGNFTALWASNTSGHDGQGYKLIIDQPNGRAVINNSTNVNTTTGLVTGGTTLWSSNTTRTDLTNPVLNFQPANNGNGRLVFYTNVTNGTDIWHNW
ncbi:hypothetical protein OHV05_35095 (plasmid) [Kitasatospora sp. NBC_00070]|uniref:hypothetical protein n=1 Tax=Kitasatospora sp. NBC_00070 TaxID=2975962 RepID=UPI002F9148E5